MDVMMHTNSVATQQHRRGNRWTWTPALFLARLIHPLQESPCQLRRTAPFYTLDAYIVQVPAWQYLAGIVYVMLLVCNVFDCLVLFVSHRI
eukprot:scaffold416572_cov18-Prasinocladus_malaysianus.AAC.1